jgi:(p)ppGpp synthase/HD superfamily hydrolase
MTSWSIDRCQKAWALATRLHHGQTYGGAAEGERIDYLSHIGSVVMEVMAALPSDPTLDGDLAIPCAILHDVLEDTEVAPDLIHDTFGERVLAGVRALTKDTSLTGKTAAITDSLRRIKLQPREVWLVKMADRIANLQHPPYYWDDAKILGYQREALLIHAELREANEAIAARLTQKAEDYLRFLE